MQIFVNRLARWAIIASMAAVLTAVQQPALAADVPAKKTSSRKIRGRLPMHYAKVVTDSQREQVYKIQEEYKPRIEPLESQLQAIKKERDEKIAAVLTPEQTKQVEEAAKARKKPTKAAAPVETPKG